MEKSVRDWLEKGGYVLEMRVARLLRSLGLSVEQGYHYNDPTTGREREGDLAAFLDIDTETEQWHALELLIECKSTTAPWVGFIGSSPGNGPFTAGSSLDLKCDLCDGMIEGFYHLRRRLPDAYAVTEKRAGNTKDHAYEGTQQVVNAMLDRYNIGGFDGHEDERLVTTLAVPIVVTESPLFACTLDEAGDIELSQVPRLNLMVPRLQVPDSESDGVEVLVVRFGELDQLVLDLRECIAQAVRGDLD